MKFCATCMFTCSVVQNKQTTNKTIGKVTKVQTSGTARGGDATTGDVPVAGVLLVVITSAQLWMAWCILGPSEVWNMNVPTPVVVRLEEETSQQCYIKVNPIMYMYDSSTQHASTTTTTTHPPTHPPTHTHPRTHARTHARTHTLVYTSYKQTHALKIEAELHYHFCGTNIS